MDANRKNPKLEFEGLVVSRVWSRDALKILETRGLVTMVPYKGAMVSTLGEHEILDLITE